MAERDVMSLSQFECELRRIARFETNSLAADGLSEAVEKIKANPTLSESRLLVRVLRALADQCGEFRRAETSGFDSGTLRMVIALMNTARDGTKTREEWKTAVQLADAAAAS
jgi:hypothetical protein